MYGFKTIPPVAPASDLTDIVLTRTQRKTPTVVRSGWDISRIREFYMRKVKFTQETLHEKLSTIVDSFPKLDDVHPFYADLINVLYDRDHYKLALGQLNKARMIVNQLGDDYVRMIKYGDSLFRCKQLKRAALGRMCTMIRKLNGSLQYLEEVRQHLARLPAIEPTSRTLIVTGYPNVGKSSFMNKVTRADVDVQPYAFTTKSIFVGHFDYRFQQWQVLDTPGILDHPLEERNTIEMQAITALAHLQAAILFFLDISEQCGFNIRQQVHLFESIKPLFTGKPLLLVCTKIDAQPWETLDEESKELIERAAASAGATLSRLSNFSEEGIADVRNTGCDQLLKLRVDGKKMSRKHADILNRVTVTLPKPRDGRTRDASIPEAILAARAAATGGGGGGGGGGGAALSSAAERDARRRAARVTRGDDSDDDGREREVTPFGVIVGSGPGGRILDRDREQVLGGPGVYRADYTKVYQLKEEDWRTDIVPEIMDGKNIADFIDPDIWRRLGELEDEEEALTAAEAAEAALAEAAEAGTLAPIRAAPAGVVRAPAHDGIAAAAVAAAEAGLDELDAEAEHALASEIRRRKKLVVARARHDNVSGRPLVSERVLERRRARRAASLASRSRGRGAGSGGGADDDMDEGESSAGAGAVRRRGVTFGDDDDSGGGGRSLAERAAERRLELKRGRSRTPVRSVHADEDDGEGRSRSRGRSAAADDDGAAEPGAKRAKDRSRSRSIAGRSVSVRPGEGLRDEAQKTKILKRIADAQQLFARKGRQGEADHFIGTKMPKHLFSGKRGIGKTDRR